MRRGGNSHTWITSPNSTFLFSQLISVKLIEIENRPSFILIGARRCKLGCLYMLLWRDGAKDFSISHYHGDMISTDSGVLIGKKINALRQ